MSCRIFRDLVITKVTVTIDIEEKSALNKYKCQDLLSQMGKMYIFITISFHLSTINNIEDLHPDNSTYPMMVTILITLLSFLYIIHILSM